MYLVDSLLPTFESSLKDSKSRAVRYSRTGLPKHECAYRSPGEFDKVKILIE